MTNENDLKLIQIWDKLMESSFVTKDIDAMMEQLTEDTHVVSIFFLLLVSFDSWLQLFLSHPNLPLLFFKIKNHIPTGAGGNGKAAVREFYSKHMFFTNPPDTKSTSISRTIGQSSVVDEMLFSFTHTQKVDWMLPNVEPTGKYMEVPLVVIVQFKEDANKVLKVASQHIYWDQASVMVQLGLIKPSELPAADGRRMPDSYYYLK